MSDKSVTITAVANQAPQKAAKDEPQRTRRRTEEKRREEVMGGFAFSLPFLCDLSALCGYPSATDSLIMATGEGEGLGRRGVQRFRT